MIRVLPRASGIPFTPSSRLAVVAMLAGMTSYEAIVQYGKERGWEFLQLLGFTTERGLCKATYSRVFRRIDVADFEARVGRWIQGRLGPGDAPHIAIDGKTARGSRDGETPGVHLVSAYAPDVTGRPGPTPGGCQDQRAQGRAGAAGGAAAEGQGRHR